MLRRSSSASTTSNLLARESRPAGEIHLHLGFISFERSSANVVRAGCHLALMKGMKLACFDYEFVALRTRPMGSDESTSLVEAFYGSARERFRSVAVEVGGQKDPYSRLRVISGAPLRRSGETRGSQFREGAISVLSEFPSED